MEIEDNKNSGDNEFNNNGASQLGLSYDDDEENVLIAAAAAAAPAAAPAAPAADTCSTSDVGHGGTDQFTDRRERPSDPSPSRHNDHKVVQRSSGPYNHAAPSYGRGGYQPVGGQPRISQKFCFKCAQINHVTRECKTYKTILCRHHPKDRGCQFDRNSASCNYAHGVSELRPSADSYCIRIVYENGKQMIFGCGLPGHFITQCPANHPADHGRQPGFRPPVPVQPPSSASSNPWPTVQGLWTS